MSSDRAGWRLRLRHVLDSIAECRSFVAGMTCDAFCVDAKTLKAVVWNIATIGEAVRHVPAEIIAALPEIPWAAMRGMRNQNAHGYDSIDYEIVWNVVQDGLPPLVPLLELVIADS